MSPGETLEEISEERSQSTVQPNADEQKLLLTIKKDWGNPASLSLWSNTGVWTGVICSSTGQVTALFLPSFHIAKPIPASICSLKNLTYIDLSYNNLTGDFPTVLYACSALELLDLSNNQLSGRLPDEIDKLSSEMQHLNLSNNGFNIGVVPSAIGRLSKLKSLQLDTNSFINNVSYPGAAIGGLAELDTPALASNPFKPDLVPKEFAMVSKLKTLWLSGRQFTLLGITKWVLKEMVAILMNIAFISGSIWLLFLRLRNRRWRDLSPLAMENGSLEEWFDCDEPFDRKMLCENARRRQGEDVQLYRRAAAPRLQAEGTLDYCCLHLPRDPDAASRSQRNLLTATSGQLGSLEKLTAESTSPFAPSPAVTVKLFQPRKLMMAMALQSPPPSPSPSGLNTFIINVPIVPISVIAGGVVIFAVGCVVASCRCRARNDDMTPIVLSDKMEDHLVHNAVDVNRIISSTGTTTGDPLYRLGVIDDSSDTYRRLTVKKMQNETRSVDAELENRRQTEETTLGMIVHPNIIILLGYIRRNDMILILYEDMENGSLDNHNTQAGERRLRPPLGWRKRLAIVIDVAGAILYMHHGCRRPIVHGDIKPANILLDGNFKAKISGFSYARINLAGRNTLRQHN
uniref:Protein kinase domain-containing protein n=1 Tax=Oryza glumipatula TaxID=40148 RepID=A0A0D9YPK5_9ORYZ